MHRCALFFIAAVFFLWVLPLGAFIKPAQEKTACDGQRAICLCTHQQAKTKSKPIEGFGLKANNNGSKESNASGGAGHYYLTAHLPVQNDLAMRILGDPIVFAYRNPFLKSIEHIPKA